MPRIISNRVIRYLYMEVGNEKSCLKKATWLVSYSLIKFYLVSQNKMRFVHFFEESVIVLVSDLSHKT